MGVPCEGCPLQSTEIGCIALRAGQTIAEQENTIQNLTEEKVRREEENALLLERLFNLRLDTLVDTAFTPEGLRDHLEHDAEIQQELRQLKWGVIRLDGRFVNYINRFGSNVGDDFLQSGGQEITSISDGLVRTGRDRRINQQTVNQEQRQDPRRQGHSLVADIICRQGGDEFALLMRSVNPAELTMVAARIQGQLAVTRALERYDEGKVPFIASVGWAHATEFTPEVTGLLARSKHWEAFRRVNGQADEGQRRTKARQYQEMWELAVASMSTDERPVAVARPSDREVAEVFLTLLCPDFMRDPISFLVHQKEQRPR